MGFPLSIPPTLERRLRPGTRVLLALSGGVDSATALALLTELGCRVECVTFKNFCYAETDDSSGRACCSLEAIEDAKRLAQRHGAVHWVADVSARFGAEVIEPFVAAYAVGLTPNPCQTCNALVRFPELVRLADRQGCDLVATGHYARIGAASRPYGTREPTGTETDGAAWADDVALIRGVDADKDQAYFLYRVARRLLPRLVFPVGWYTKRQIRGAAEELDLPVAHKLESQEICFVPDGDRSFLFPAGALTEPGEITDRGGEVLGRHRGLVHYTVGQRRGLGIAAPQPLYVLTLDPAHNRLVVGPREELAATRIVCDDFQAGVPDFPATGPDVDFAPTVTARIRHRHAGAPVASWRRDDQRLVVQLTTPVDGLAPGQGLVLYAEDVVLGGGRIIASPDDC